MAHAKKAAAPAATRAVASPAAAAFKPYVPDSASMPEFTPRAVILGMLFGIIFGAVTVYVGLRAGLTVSASIPIAVLSISLLRAMGRATILNVNVPNLPLAEVKGIRVTRLGNHHRSGAIIKAEDPRGRPVYWVGPSGPWQDESPGTDFHAVMEGYVSVTPLTIDLTNHAALDGLRNWFGS